MQRFRGGLVVKAHRLVYHSTLGSRVTNKKKKNTEKVARGGEPCESWSEEEASSAVVEYLRFGTFC